jgi:hypothetical protein
MSFGTPTLIETEQSKTAGTSVVTGNNIATIASNDVILVAVAVDNQSSTDGATNEVTSISTNTGSETYTKIGEYCNGQGGANSGATVALFAAQALAAHGLGTKTWTANLANSKTAKAIAVQRVTIGAGKTLQLEDIKVGAWDGTTPSVTPISGLAAVDHLFVVATATEDPSASGFFTSYSVAAISTSGGGGASNMGVKLNVQSVNGINTSESPSQVSYPSADGAYVFVSFKEATAAATLVASQASYSVTGNATGLTKQSKLAMVKADFALTLQNAGLRKGYPMPAVQAGYVLTFRDASFRKTWKMLADQGAYALTGNATGLRKGYPIVAGLGSYALTGNAAGLRRGYPIVAGLGSYALTGNASTLRWGHKLAAAQAAYALTLRDAAFLKGFSMSAAQSSYALTGNANTLRWGRKLAAAQAAYALTGNASTLRWGHKLTAAQVAYALTGNAAGLTHTVDRRLTADSQSYGVTGNATGLAWGRKLAAAQAAYALTGNATGFATGRRIVAESGSLSVTGQAVGLTRQARVSMQQASFALTFNDTILRANRALTAEFGSFALSGIDVELLYTPLSLFRPPRERGTDRGTLDEFARFMRNRNIYLVDRGSSFRRRG